MRKAAFIVLIAGLLAAVAAAGLGAAGVVRLPLMPGYETARCGPETAMSKCCCSPFGGYCEGSGWGWYGAGKAVKTPAEAGSAIRKFFLPRKVNAADIREKGTFFQAEVKDSGNKTIDTVIVNKRTGRISSIY